MTESLRKKLFESNDRDDNFLDLLQTIISPIIQPVSLITLNLVDKDFLDEVKSFAEVGTVSIYFGKTLGDLKCVIRDNSERDHEILIKYNGPRKLTIVSAMLPYSTIQEREYRTLDEIIVAFRSFVNSLASYLYELERIDHSCSVMEPLHPSFKDDFRRILIDDRTWLHVEVTIAGLAANIHLVGQSDTWHEKLQSGLLSWDHDKDIVENIMSVLDISEFPVPSHRLTNNTLEDNHEKAPTCGICLTDELPDDTGLPLPLCQNPNCRVYFHRNCLYQWLVACSRCLIPAFGVANGACPTCLQAISCSEKDD